MSQTETQTKEEIPSICAVENFSERLQFINLARQLQKQDPHFVPPLLPEMLKTLNPKKNPFFEHAQAKLFLAKRGKKTVGRIAAIVDWLHDETHKERCGFFGYFECEDNAQTARLLLNAASEWLKQSGAKILRGPVNLSTNNECGLLVEGFNTPPAILMPHNPPYHEALLLDYGLKPIKDLLAYDVWAKNIQLDRMERIVNRIKERRRITIRILDMKRFDEEVGKIGKIFNEAWAKNWGFVPSTEKELRFTAAGLKPIIVPEIVLFAEVDGKEIGFIAPIPDVNVAIKKIDGRLFPFGFLRLLFLLKKIDRFRLPLFGVHPKYRAAGVEGVLLYEMIRRGIARGVKSCECSWVLEDNVLMRRAIEGIQGEIYKRYRIYEKAL